jgi:hypothetical protein
MDKETEKLYAQLGGIGTPDTIELAPREAASPSTKLSKQDENLDGWRTLLVELAYLLNASFRDAHYWDGIKSDKDTIGQFESNIRELEQMPGHDGIIRIHHRGLQNAKVSELIDYVIEFGDVTVDMSAIKALTRRMGLRVKHLEGRLQKSFEAFASQGIKTLMITIPEDSEESLEAMSIALRVMSCFNYAVENEATISFDRGDNQYSLVPISDDLNQPDPNLTLVAALNGISPEIMQNLVTKVKNAVQGRNLTLPEGQPLTIYQAIFQMKSLRRKLTKPPVEINTNTPATVPTNQAAGSAYAAGPAGVAASPQTADSAASPQRADGAASPPAAGSVASPAAAPETESPAPETESQTQKIESQAPKVESPAPAMVYPIDPGIVKARVAQFVKQSYGKSPQQARQTIKSIYARDFKTISRDDLGKRLLLITDLLHGMAQKPKGRQLMQEVLGRIERGMDHAPQGLLDDFLVDDKDIKIGSDKGEKTVNNADEGLLDVIDHARQKSAEKKKMRSALNPTGNFSQQDFERIANDFDISARDVEQIVQLFKSCFDDQNNFLRASFETKVSKFAQCKKVFDILWEFLKETQHRGDRLPFLNSLQTLVKEVNNPIRAIKVLLTDFILDPDGVKYPDRNAIMLVNQFLRTYNKEINMDIEITPEEVLLIKEGLNTAAVNYARWKVDGDQNAFLEKFVTIRKLLLKSIETNSADSNQLPIRFLLALEREIHIFLSLLGGSTAYMVIRGALDVYGDPQSEVYQSPESQNHISALLQHLGVLIRGFGRLGKIEDLTLLDEVKSRQEMFLSLVGEDVHHNTLVTRFIGWIDASENNIFSRHR